MKIQRQNQKGFTLVEIMIVVAIVGMLSSIAIPNFVKARTISRKNTCMANLRQLENAKTIWANEHGRSGTHVPAETELCGPDKYLRLKPICPAGGTYTIPSVDEKTTCSLSNTEGHSL